MNLPGRLKLSTLGDMLGVLHRAGASGVLELIEQDGSTAGRTHRVYLDGGLIDGVESRLATPKLGEILLREGLIGLEGVRLLLRKLIEQPGKKAGQILLDERLVDSSLLEASLRAQLRARLEALFKLRDAFVRFHVRRPPGGRRASLLTPREFLHGRPRARAARPPEPRASEGSSDALRRSAYIILGLRPGADAQAVRRAFRKLAALHHPDRHPGATAAEKALLAQRFSQITAAYHRLSS
jgi:DnaJ-domain-containing protein 1